MTIATTSTDYLDSSDRLREVNPQIYPSEVQNTLDTHPSFQVVFPSFQEEIVFFRKILAFAPEKGNRFNHSSVMFGIFLNN